MKNAQLSFLIKSKRSIIYVLFLLLILLGHHYFMQIPMDLFRYIRQSTMSMICVICFYGAFMLLLQKKWVRADMLFIFLMIMVGLTNLLSLIRGFTIGYAAVFEYNFMSAPMLLYGIIYAYFFILYPLEAFRPGWLTIKRAALLFTPALFILILYLFETRVFNITTPTFKDLSTFLLESSRSYIFLIILILAYPIFGIAVMLKYRKGYIEWCENNFASMENIDIKWLSDYIYANLMITISCLIVVFGNDVRTGLMHNIIFLVFFLYGFYRVLFWKSPYPENHFKDGMNEKTVQITQENDTIINKSFTDRLPGYKAKLVQWMETEKPYLRKEFKLSDALKILPLNRSYLSRLFNEGIHGYGYGQDEDQGQLGAWYVMAAMGLFDVKGLTGIDPKLQIGSPLFDKITIKLNKDYYKGDTFVIETRNNSKENIYIESINLNGADYNSVQLDYAKVVDGGKMVITLSDKPNFNVVLEP
jgi:hypothetical protein